MRNQRSNLQQQVETGVLPCGNCMVTVDQDRLVAVERFGQYSGTLDPGLAFVGCDLFGCCITYRSITKRTEECSVSVATKTAGQMMTHVNVTLQHGVDRDKLQNALYLSGDLPSQIEAHVAHAVNSHWPKWGDKGVPYNITEATEKQIKDSLGALGIQVHKVIQSYTIPAEVAAAQELKAKLTREKESVVHQAEAAKNMVVKKAEAAADAAALQGEGTARQRAAIIDGLRESISSASGESLSSERITELMYITQHFETLRAISSGPDSNVCFVSDEARPMLQAPGVQTMETTPRASV